MSEVRPKERPEGLTILAAGAVGLGAVALYSGVVWKLLQTWWTDPNYSHGFVVAPIAVLLLWQKRGRLLTAAPQPSHLGLALLVGSLLLLVVGKLGAELFLTRLSLLGVLAGGILFVGGRAHLRLAAFPLLLLCLCVPLPAIVANGLLLKLQLAASALAERLMRGVGLAVFRDGNVLVLPNVTLQVSEACSGIRSLFSLATIALLLAKMSDMSHWRRATLVLATVPFAVVMNAVRIAATGLAASTIGPEAAEGAMHEACGWLSFLAALLVLYGLQRLLQLGPTRRARSFGCESPSPEPATL